MLNNLHAINKLYMIKMQEVVLLDMKNHSFCLSFSRDKAHKGKHKR